MRCAAAVKSAKRRRSAAPRRQGGWRDSRSPRSASWQLSTSNAQGFCAVECDEEFVAHVVAAFGDDNLVTTTDYPHGDAKYPEAMNRFLALPLSEGSKKKILWDNVFWRYDL